MRCLRCNRPLKHPGIFGPVCKKREAPTPAVERDLFGYDTQAACAAAQVNLAQILECRVLDVLVAIRREYEAMCERRGVPE